MPVTALHGEVSLKALQGEGAAMPNEYVDVRGVYPVYVNGVKAVVMPGKPRDISVDDARAFVKEIGA